MIKKTKLHPDGDESVILYPETSADQIPDLIQKLNAAGISAKPFQVGTVTTLPAGSKATVSFQQTETAVLVNWGIPMGAIGETGPQGEKGDRGLIGAVGPEGPRGIQGPAGPQGVQGIQGIQGPAGANGRSFQITGQVNSVTDLPAATAAYIGLAYYVGENTPRDIYACVDNNGTIAWENQGTLQGPEGPVGPQGPQGPQGVQGPEGATGSNGRDGNGVVGITGIGYSQGAGQYEGYTDTRLELNTDEENMEFHCYARNGETGLSGIPQFTGQYVGAGFLIDQTINNLKPNDTFTVLITNVGIEDSQYAPKKNDIISATVMSIDDKTININPASTVKVLTNISPTDNINTISLQFYRGSTPSPVSANVNYVMQNRLYPNGVAKTSSASPNTKLTVKDKTFVRINGFNNVGLNTFSNNVRVTFFGIYTNTNPLDISLLIDVLDDIGDIDDYRVTGKTPLIMYLEIIDKNKSASLQLQPYTLG